jgi:hypothetical protein
MTASLALADVDDKSPSEITKERINFMRQFLRLKAEVQIIVVV